MKELRKLNALAYNASGKFDRMIELLQEMGAVFFNIADEHSDLLYYLETELRKKARKEEEGA